MADLKPPRSLWGEAEALGALLQYQRQSVLRKVEGLSDDQARRELVGSDTTLMWLLKHLARAERMWVLGRFAGGDAGPMDDTVAPEDTLAGLAGAYRSTWAEVDAVVAAALDSAPGLDAPASAPGPDGPVNLRWVLMHLLEETARHAGHADILRELIDGATGR